VLLGSARAKALHKHVGGIDHWSVNFKERSPNFDPEKNLAFYRVFLHLKGREIKKNSKVAN